VSLNQPTETICGGGDECTLTGEGVVGIVGFTQRCDDVAPEAATEVLVLLAEALLKLSGRHREGVRNNEAL
jgi:hypothetical protein